MWKLGIYIWEPYEDITNGGEAFKEVQWTANKIYRQTQPGM